ncbi:hypothetical protein TI04_04190 [Achromatium sp. WMS2]|nr:hypothetical protein TI04_04190 [Achromatium sp. WMS2]
MLKRPPNIRGFTLIEALLVMALVAVFAALVPPLLSKALPGIQMKATARIIASAMRRARINAINTGKDVSLIVDIERYTVQVGDSNYIIHIPTVLNVKLDTADQELIDNQRGGIRFYPNGTSTGGRVTLYYQTNGYGMDVDWLTGRVQILPIASPP